MNKLEGIPVIHYITLKESLDRRKNLEKWFGKFNVTNYMPHFFDRNIDLSKYDFIGQDKFPQLYQTISQKKLLISHFSVLREWYENTNEDSLIVFEDDVSFETVQYWNFTWKEFEERIPNNCECIQLCLIRYKCDPYEFAPREPLRRGHWSACAYYMKRSYVKHLLDTYNPVPNKFIMNLRGEDNLFPDVEAILFLDVDMRVYVFPLFLEDCYTLKSTISKSENSHRYMSHDCVLNWWKESGQHQKINQIMGIELDYR